ncbi:MAG: transketolase, partial [Saccharopolyspora sp.]
DVSSILDALDAAKGKPDQPTLIVLRTVIGYPAPNKMNSGKAHGAALGGDEVAGIKKELGFDPEKSFEISDEVLSHARQVVDRAKTSHAEWQKSYDNWAAANPDREALLNRMRTRELPAGWQEKLPSWEADGKGIATRKASGEILGALADVLPELWGGSADLAESNNTTMKGVDSFGPAHISTEMWPAQPYGRTLHFGVREHAMGSILNGIALHGGTRPYGGTFLIFSDYMRPAVRLAALMRAPVVYVWTHDSIGLGEDGPTHQPIEQLSALRAIPGLSVVRPADANETAHAWKAVLEDTSGPAGLALTRQGVPTLEGTDADGVAKGGYVLAEAANGAPELVLIATGSEVQLAVEARKILEDEGVATRVVSMPCVEWFDRQDRSYREQVLPPSVRARVAVEAGIAQSWYRFVKDAGEIVSIEHFGASADYKTLFEKFGFTTGAVTDAARRSLDNARSQA